MAPKQPEPYKGPILWHRDQDIRDGTKEGVHSGKWGATLPNTSRGGTSTTGKWFDDSSAVDYNVEAMGQPIGIVLFYLFCWF